MQPKRAIQRIIFILIIVFSALIANATPLTGVKTIGGSTPDYPTFTGAVSALATNGVGIGGVTFNVRSGTYNERFTINSITGASQLNPIVFQKESGTVTIASTGGSGSNDVMVTLRSADWVTFDGINITDNGTSSSNYVEQGFLLTDLSGTDGCLNNTIKNCTITLNRTNNYSIGIFSNTSPSNATGYNQNNHYLNLKITNCSIGMKLFGYDNNAEIGSTSRLLTDANRFIIGSGGANDITQAGITMNAANGVNIHNIDICNLTTTNANAYGITFSSVTGTNTVTGCRFYNIVSTTTWTTTLNASAIFFNGCESSSYVTHSFIWGIAATSAATSTSSNVMVSGLKLNNSNNCYIYFNSILLHQSLSNSYAMMAGILDQNSTCSTIDNVIELVTANATPHYNFYVTNSTNWSSNTNVFYNTTVSGFTSNYLCSYNGTNYTTLSSWRSAANYDMFSYQASPMFVNETTTGTDLHIALFSNSPVYNVAVSMGNAYDIDGDYRNSNHHSIGADEGYFDNAPLSGTKIIGSNDYDFSNLTVAANAIAACGLSGPVTFWIEPKIYPEQIVIPYTSAMSDSVSVTFMKNPNHAGTVQISPAVTDSGQAAITLKGCYVTIQDLAIVDTSTGTYGLTKGLFVTNTSSSTGAQHNTFKNCSITLRNIDNQIRYGVYQKNTSTPSSLTGSQSYNRYINLKISKVTNGVWIFGTYPYTDLGTEIGSDSVGTAYPNRFTIGALGAQDTIGGSVGACGIYSVNVQNIRVHDVDIMSLRASASISGINIIANGSIVNDCTFVYNCRVRNCYSTTTGVTGMNVGSSMQGPVRVYNNMIGNLYVVNSGGTTNSSITGIYVNGNRPCIDHNTILLDDGGLASTRNAYTFGFLSNTVDTLRNNIIANMVGNGTLNVEHTVIRSMNNNSYVADNNCYFYNTAATQSNFFKSDMSSTVLTMSQWQAQYHTDNHSVFYLPQFFNTADGYDLHPQLYQMGALIDQTNQEASAYPPRYVATDIDANLRSLPADIGACEGRFSSSPIDLGSIPLGGCDSMSVVYYSPQPNGFVTTGVSTETNRFSARIVNSNSTILPGDALCVYVRFTGDSVGIFTDTLSITMAGSIAPIQALLSATVLGTYVTIPTTNLTFPNPIAVGGVDSLDLPILVSGTQALATGRWITIPATAPFYISPNPVGPIPANSVLTSRVYFAPTSNGNFSAHLGFISNALNGDTITVPVSGYGQGTPNAPGLSIGISGDNVNLSWSRPDTTVLRYLVYFRNSNSIPWQFLTATFGCNATSTTHVSVVRFSPQMYYQVTAWYGESVDSFDKAIRSIPVGTPKDEVDRRLQTIPGSRQLHLFDESKSIDSSDRLHRE